jgi:hypothetical protein
MMMDMVAMKMFMLMTIRGMSICLMNYYRSMLATSTCPIDTTTDSLTAIQHLYSGGQDPTHILHSLSAVPMDRNQSDERQKDWLATAHWTCSICEGSISSNVSLLKD